MFGEVFGRVAVEEQINEAFEAFIVDVLKKNKEKIGLVLRRCPNILCGL